MHERMVSKYGKAKALSIIAQKLGRIVYFMLKRKEPFSKKRFFGDGVSVFDTYESSREYPAVCPVPTCTPN
jgi:hypothetical protein